MADELWETLVRFHREVTVPSIMEPLREEIRGATDSLRRDMNSHFDAVYKRLDRLESEYHALSAAVKRIEERLSAVEQKIDRMALRSELLELRDRVARLEERISELENEV